MILCEGVEKASSILENSSSLEVVYDVEYIKRTRSL